MSCSPPLRRHEFRGMQSNDWPAYTPDAFVIEDHGQTTPAPVEESLYLIGYAKRRRPGFPNGYRFGFTLMAPANIRP
jgi:hypothetical protein